MFPMLVLFVIVSLLIYHLYIKKPNDFWKEYGVKQVPHSSLVEKAKLLLGQKSIGDLDGRVYRSLGKDEKFCGFMQMLAPYLFVKDLDLVKQILIKDFEHFTYRRAFGMTKSQPIISKMLGNLHGEEWKGVRNSLSPTFTTGKIRRMMDSFNTVSDEWILHFEEKIKNNGGRPIEINVLHETTQYTVDIIANSVFGMRPGTIKNPNSYFSRMAKKMADFGVGQVVRFGLSINFPRLTNLFQINVFDGEALQFFESILKQGLEARMNGVVKRNDFMQLVAEARKGEVKAQGSDELSSFEKEALLQSEGDNKNWLSDEELASAQMLIFFFAGFSTISTVVGYAMYCLALNPECQDKLRKELNQKLFKDGEEHIDYDLLNELDYLDMCVSETLRKFPPAGRLERQCTKEYMDTENNFQVPKGAYVAVPISSFHNDPKYYEFPDKFYPEHFSTESKAKRNPYAYLPFGTGPRNCIGMRFAQVEVKAAIAKLVHNFEISPAKSTPIPYRTKSAAFGLAIPDELELSLSPARK